MLSLAFRPRREFHVLILTLTGRLVAQAQLY